MVSMAENLNVMRITGNWGDIGGLRFQGLSNLDTRAGTDGHVV